MLWMFVGGLICLVIGAEMLVRGSSRLALSFGISPLVVGLTIVAFGTSSPEVAVSVAAALDDRSDIAVGNVVGSNIFNVLFILGVSALITPLIVNAQIIRQEVPIMIGSSLLLLALGLDGSLSLFDCLLLLALLAMYTLFLIVQSRRQSQKTQDTYSNATGTSRWDAHWSVQLVLIVAGLGLLVFGSDLLVGAATAFAKAVGISELVISLTIVAAGTSMPELATSVMAAIRKERDIAIGNVVGSNTFNILGCLGLTGLAAPTGVALAPSLLSFDIWVMLAVAFACLPVFVTGRQIARWEGLVFIAYYVAYAAYLILAAQAHDVLPMFSTVMLSFVVPLTVVTIIVIMLRQPESDLSSRP